MNNRLDQFIAAAESNLKSIDYKIVSEGEIGEDVKKNLQNIFINEFYISCTIRMMFTYFNLLHTTNTNKEVNGIGINQYLPKKAFLHESNVRYFNLPESLAEGLAKNENVDMFYKIEETCERRVISRKKIRELISTSRENYDIILSKGRFTISTDFEDVTFKESWSLPEYNHLPDFLGILDEHYKVFYVNLPQQDGYVLLNSKKLGFLNQYNPPDLKNGERNDIFNFSIIDFKDDSESLANHEAQGTEQNILRENIWFRVFEKYEIDLNQDFQGLTIDLSD
jgi:hypothetical protein